jgi:hypothetical protein
MRKQSILPYMNIDLYFFAARHLIIEKKEKKNNRDLSNISIHLYTLLNTHKYLCTM